MRWRIRFQLLLPLILLLLAVVGSSVWMVIASAHRVHDQIETRIREVVAILTGERGNYPLNENILALVRGLSGAHYYFIPTHGDRRTTLKIAADALPGKVTVYKNAEELRLGPPLAIEEQTYFCAGIQLEPPRESGTLYVLYPQSQWRDQLWDAMGPVVVLGGSFGIAGLALSLMLGQSLIRRLGLLQRRTRLIAAGDFSPMSLPEPDDEIRDLTRSVNEMASQLAHLQQTVQRAERLRLLDQVSGGLAHELRNGLTGARLALQLFTEENPTHRQDEVLQVALRQLELLESQLQRFFELGQSEKLEKIRCSLPERISEAVSLLHPRCRHTGIDLHWQAPAEGIPVEGDPAQLGQVMVNLIGNAIDAAGPSGQIRIQVGHDRTAWVEVWDSGPGPDSTIADRLFEPFVTGKPEGVGLGLAVSRQMITAHGGQLHWFRRNGQTCFRVDLPLLASTAIPAMGVPQ